MGREGVGNTNSNGLLLLTKCSEYDLAITKTLFRQKTKFKTSWMHPCSKRWHLIDYVIVRSEARRDVLSTRAMISADECWTDHCLIRSTMSIHLMRKRRQQKRQTRPRLNIERLGETTYQRQLQAALSADLPDHKVSTGYWKALGHPLCYHHEFLQSHPWSQNGETSRLV